MKKTINNTHIEGLLYQHTLELKKTGPGSKNPGTEFISGNIEIATDNDKLNVVPVHFTFVTPTFGQGGKANPTFDLLKNIIDGTLGAYMTHGADKATKLRIDSSIGFNEFYVDDGSGAELRSAKRNEGGFVHTTQDLVDDENKRATFEVDMLIENVICKEADEERGYPAKDIIKGYVFDFRNSFYPVEFSAIDPAAMNYFESLDASEKNPVFTKIWGNQISETIKRHREEESAFGAAKIHETNSTHKEFVITGAAKDVYAYGDEGILTEEEVKKGLADREIYLADMKRRQDEYKNNKNNAITPTPAATTTYAGGFDF